MINYGSLPCPRAHEPVAAENLVITATTTVTTPIMVFRGNVQALLSMSLPHLALTTNEKRHVSIREFPAFPSPLKILGAGKKMIWWKASALGMH
ncbi:hypothetical protein ACLB2K_072717 [Fragaria x ananassa]